MHNIMSKNHVLRLTAAVVFVAWSLTVSAQKTVERDPVPMPTVSADTLIKHVMELSSESYRGRLAGSDGFNSAADYAGHVLARYGLVRRPLSRWNATKWRTASSTYTVPAPRTSACSPSATSSAVPA